MKTRTSELDPKRRWEGGCRSWDLPGSMRRGHIDTYHVAANSDIRKRWTLCNYVTKISGVLQDDRDRQ